MKEILTNIVKGASRKRTQKSSRFAAIPWCAEKIIKHQNDVEKKVYSISGLKIAYQRPYEFLHAYKEIFGVAIYAFETKTERPVILDCGANIGISALYFKKIHPGACLTCFEPDQKNFALLRENVETNKLTDTLLENSAVWVKDGSISFRSDNSEASRISVDSNGMEVNCVDLNKFISNVDRVTFLKMDIEGAEKDVIPHIRQNLQKVDNLFLEYHGKTSDTKQLKELIEIVEQGGFKTYIRNAADNIAHPFVEKTSSLPFDVQLNIFCYR